MPVASRFLPKSLERRQLERQTATRSGMRCTDCHSNEARHELGRRKFSQVKACDPACKTSIDVIGCYVAMYGGGEHMVLINFLSKFSNLAATISK